MQCLLHDHPLAKWCVFGLFATSTYDIAIGIPLIESIYPYQETNYIDNTDYTQYIYLYNLIQLVIVVPFCLLLLDIAVLSVQKKYRKLREQEIIMKQTMAFERKELMEKLSKNQKQKSLNNKSRGPSNPYGNEAEEEEEEKKYDGYNEYHLTAHGGRKSKVEMHPNPLAPEMQQHLNVDNNTNRDRQISNDIDGDGDDSEEESEHDDHGRQKSAALNVFLSSINAAQVQNQQQQQQEEMERISRLNKLANMPLQHGAMHKISSAGSPQGSNGPESPIEFGAMITPQNTDHSMYNMPYDPSNTLLSQPEITEKKVKKKSTLSGLRRKTKHKVDRDNSSSIRNRQISKSRTDRESSHEAHTIPLTIPLNTSNTPRRPQAHTAVSATSAAPLDKTRNGKRTVCKRLMGKIILNPIIVASAAAFICRALVSKKIIQNMEPYLENVSSIYEFLALYIVGSLLAVFFEQRLNIFKFAAQNHQDKKSKILNRIGSYLQRNKKDISASLKIRRPNTTVNDEYQLEEKRDGDGYPLQDGSASPNILNFGYSYPHKPNMINTASTSPPPQSYNYKYSHYNDQVFTPNLPEYNHEETDIFAAAIRARSETNVWTYTQSPTGGIHFRQKKVTMTEIEDMMRNSEDYGYNKPYHHTHKVDNLKREASLVRQTTNMSQTSATIPSSISLMNTDNVMMWWWALSFVLLRYLISSLSFRFVSFGIYQLLPFNEGEEDSSPKMTQMHVINYLYGTITPNLLSLIIAMKYNIYISFITISYMISIVLYPVIAFCGLLLFTGVGFDAMQESVRIVVYSVQLCSIVSAFFMLLFWYGFKHWRTYPITIFMIILIADVAYNCSYFTCEYLQYYDIDDPTYIFIIVYFFRQYVRLLLLSAAFQSCIFISTTSVLKRELKRYHQIIQPVVFILSAFIAGFLWFIRHNQAYSLDFTWNYPFDEFSTTYKLQCQYSSKVQLQIDLIIQSGYALLLAIMFYYILRKRYQYEISEIIYDRNGNQSGKNRSMLLQMFFCCYLKCCSCCVCGNQYKKHQRRKRKKKRRKKKKKGQKTKKSKNNQSNGNDKSQPLLANHGPTSSQPTSPLIIKQPSNSVQSYKHKISETPNSHEHEITPDNVQNIELSNGDAVKQAAQKLSDSNNSQQALKLNQFLSHKNSSPEINWNYQMDSEVNIMNQTEAKLDLENDNPDSLPQQMMVDGKTIEIRSDFHRASTISNHSSHPQYLAVTDNKLFDTHSPSQSAMVIVTEDNYLSPENTNINNSFRHYKKSTDVSVEYIFSARVDCDPTSLETYYQFDYYAYTLIIYCVALIGLIANVIFIVFLLQADIHSEQDDEITPDKNAQVLELLMLLSVFQHGQTFFIAILFLSTKPIKRLTKNLWQRCRVRCQLMSQNIKEKVEDDDDDTFGDDEYDDVHNLTQYEYDDGYLSLNNENNIDSNDKKLNDKRKIEEKYKSAGKIVKLPRQFYHRLPVLW